MAKNKMSMLPLVTGVFLLFLVFGIASSRTDKPIWDGEQNQFSIEHVSNDDRAEIGTAYGITARVTNVGDEAGSMYAQCSILDMADPEIGSWLKDVGLQSFSTIENNETIVNCYDDTRTQTVKVTLDRGDSDRINFAVIVPDVSDPYIYCAVYEACYGDRPGTQTDDFRRKIAVVANDGDESNNAAEPEADDASADATPGYPCTLDRDCKGYFFKGVVCHEGYCLDSEDVPCEPACASDEVCKIGECVKEDAITDLNIKEWISEHRIAVMGVAIILVIIGAFGVFPKSP